MVDDGTGDWETCDECGRLVCFGIDCPNGWRWENGEIVGFHQHDHRDNIDWEAAKVWIKRISDGAARLNGEQPYRIPWMDFVGGTT